MQISVPKITDEDFIRIENLIDSEYEAIEIETEIEENQEKLDCFNIVQKKVENHGGKFILGWQIWKSTILIEAEAHAVWEDENGELQDVSPKDNNYNPEKILFIEDPRLKYDNKQIDSIRLNITSNRLVDHFIELSKLFFHYRNKGIRANYHDLSEILDRSEIQEIQEIYDWKKSLELFIYKGNTDKDMCFCGGLKQYNNCHGRDFYKTIKKLKN